MKHIKNVKEFDKIWNESPALVCDFSASWCGPCHALEFVLKKLEEAYPNTVFAKVDVDKQPALSDSYGTRAMPTVVFVKDGKEIKRVIGYNDFKQLGRQMRDLFE